MNRTYAPIRAFVDELVRCGLRHSVTSPGSRNAPLALTLAELTEATSVIDERSAGFLALGMAKATRRPVAVTCTSGTAAANLLPAVVEARESRVPLIVLTADRPPELREVGAGQSIDQVKIYGSAVRWFVEVGNHEPGHETAIHHRALACRAFQTAAQGPVHLNFGLREPLAPVPDDRIDPADWAGREDGGPWTRRAPHSTAPDATAVQALAERMAQSPRGAIVCGPVDEDVAEPAARLAALTGWALLAEPTSGVRCGEHDRSHVVAHYDVGLRLAQPPADLVLRVGDTPTSKPLREWLLGVPQVLIDPDAAWHEPTRRAELVLDGSPAATLDALGAALEARHPVRNEQWLEAWRAVDAATIESLAQAPDPFEPRVWAALAESLPAHAIVWLASSMPVRDVEAFFPSTAKPLRFLANRGANGIDGTVSSAAGAALATGRPAFLLTGELALLHDIGGLLAARRAGAELTVVCANNGGGGIFDFLPVAQHADPAPYEEHIATPSGIDLARVAALAEMDHRVASTPAEVREAAASPALVEVRTDRAASVREHRALVERVGDALGD